MTDADSIFDSLPRDGRDWPDMHAARRAAAQAAEEQRERGAEDGMKGVMRPFQFSMADLPQWAKRQDAVGPHGSESHEAMLERHRMI
jgi:hypothetical protein